MQPNQIFYVARKYLGAERVARIYNRELRSAYNWSADQHSEHRCRNPLELTHQLFSEMDDHGLGYAVLDAISYLQSAVCPGELGPVIEPLPTIEQEILADYTAVADMQRSIDAGDPIDDIKHFLDLAKAELDRTVARVIKDRG